MEPRHALFNLLSPSNPIAPLFYVGASPVLALLRPSYDPTPQLALEQAKPDSRLRQIFTDKGVIRCPPTPNTHTPAKPETRLSIYTPFPSIPLLLCRGRLFRFLVGLSAWRRNLFCRRVFSPLPAPTRPSPSPA